jgi:1-phosphofructokinase
LHVNGLEVGGTNRVVKTVDIAAGKGVNVAKFLRRMDMEAACIGFMPESNNEIMFEKMGELGIIADFTPCPGALRVNFKVRDMRFGQVTELNFPGPEVGEEQIDALFTKARAYAKTSDILVLSGSLPAGVTEDLYARMVAECRADARCVVDAGGEMLRLAVAEKPFLIKPNKSELEMTMGKRLIGLRDVVRASRLLVEQGAEVVVTSLGPDGAALVTKNEAYHCAAVQVALGSTVGAGDAMVAGMSASFIQGESLENVLRRGVLWASLSIAAHPDRINEQELFESMAVHSIDV